MRYRLRDKNQYQKIILQLSTNSYNRHIHGILPYLEGISPKKVNFIPKIAIFPISWHFSQASKSLKDYLIPIFL